MSKGSSVFISYRRKDTDFIRQLDAAFRQAGRDVWVDWEDIPPGVLDFQDEIQVGIDKSQSVVPVLSPEYLESEYCLMELDYAHRCNKRLVPIVHRPVDPAKVPESISHINWIYFTPDQNFEAAFQKLLRAMDTDYDHLKQHTDLLIQARQWQDRGYEPSLLLGGKALRDAEAWLTASQNKSPHASDLHQDYIHRSRRRATRRRQITGLITAVVAIIMALSVAAYFFAVQAGRERNRALEAQSEAEQARDLARAAEQEANRNKQQADLARDRALTAQQQAELNADEAQSLALSGSALLVLQDDDTDLAIALAMAADAASAQLEPIPFEIERALATAAYQPGTRRLIEGHSGQVRAIAILPNNPNFAISAAHDGGLNLWNLTTGERVRRYRGHTKQKITCVAVSPDGRWAISGGEDRALIQWDVESGQVLRRFDRHQGTIRAVAISPDGRLVASGGEDGNLRLWDAETGQLIWSVLPTGNLFILDIAFHPDGGQLLASYTDGGVGLWDIASQSETARLRAFQRSFVYSAAFSPDGNLLAATLGDQIFVWELLSQGVVLVLNGHTDLVTSLEFSSNGQWLISGASDDSVRIWDLETGGEVLRLAGHEDLVWSAVFLPSSNPDEFPAQALSGSEDFDLRLWDLQDGSEVRAATLRDEEGQALGLRSSALSPDRGWLALGTQSGMVYLVDSETGAVLSLWQAHAQAINALAYSADGQYLATASNGDNIKIWEVNSSKLLQTLTHPVHSRALSLAFLPDSPWLLAGYPEGDVVKWDWGRRSIEAEWGEQGRDHEDDVAVMALSPDGQWVATGDLDEQRPKVVVWEAATGALKYELFGHRDYIRALTFSPDSRYLVSAGEDNLIIEWNLSTGEADGLMQGHTGPVLSLFYDLRGERLISGGADLSLRVWDAAFNGELRRFEAASNDLIGAYFPTDTLGLSVGHLGVLQWWRVDRLPDLVDWAAANRYLRPLSENECMVYRAQELCAAGGG